MAPLFSFIFNAMKLVTIKTFVYPHEATFAMHLLEDNGIRSFLMDEVSIQINPIYSNTLGGAKLQVWEQDAEQALLLLAHNDITPVEDVEQFMDEKELAAQDANETPWLTYKKIGFILLLIVFGLVLFKVLLGKG